MVVGEQIMPTDLLLCSKQCWESYFSCPQTNKGRWNSFSFSMMKSSSFDNNVHFITLSFTKVCSMWSNQMSLTFWFASNGHSAKTVNLHYAHNNLCISLQIRLVEEQLKQQVIGERYCISRKRKSYKGSTSHSRLVKCLVRNEKLSSLSKLSSANIFRLDESIFGVW